MVKSKAWDWEIIKDNDNRRRIWLKPAIESYYLIDRWKEQGKKDFLDLGCGLGRHTIQFAKAGFTATKSNHVNAPIINELAVCLECKVKSFDHDSCILKGEIVNVSVDESALTDGRVDVSKVKPITFDPFNNTYHVVGEKVGDAWGSGKSLM